MNDLDRIIHDQSQAIVKMTIENEILKNERDIAIGMLARWCIAVEEGSGWDYWNEHYKVAAFRDGPIRYLIDAVMEK